MSDLMSKPQLSDSKDCPAVSQKPIHQKIVLRKAQIGDSLTIRRALPSRERRMIGAWCFLDHFGPLDLKKSRGLNIAPHPHIGLQTFTWTVQGTILHRDSLGSQQIIQPGQINLMTAGNGIAHSEESMSDGVLQGVQLWIALPDVVRDMQPSFIHYPRVPVINRDGFQMSLLAGELLNKKSETRVYSAMMGLEIKALSDAKTNLPLNPTFEYGILLLNGKIEIENEILEPDTLFYLGCGRTELKINAPEDSIALMIGGEPFSEEILIWWNFVARTKEELIQAAADWENRVRFGEVNGYQGGRLHAPEISVIKNNGNK